MNCDLVRGLGGTSALYTVSVISQNGNMEPADKIRLRFFDPHDDVLEAYVSCVAVWLGLLPNLALEENFKSAKSSLLLL